MSRDGKQADLDATDLPVLPEGWCWATMDALLREPLRNGHSAKKSENGTGVRTLTLTAVTKGDFSEHNTKLTVARAEQVADLWLVPGDILIERSNTPELVGTAKLFRGSKDYAIFPDLLIRIRLLPPLLPEYVESLLQSYSVRVYFRRRAQGIAGSMPKIDQTTIAKVPVPVAPLPEQHRIVAKIEELFSDLDAGVAALQRAKAKLKRYRAAVLKAAVEGKLTDPKENGGYFLETEWKRIDLAITTLEQGWSPKCDSMPAENHDIWGVIKTTAVQPLCFLEGENKRLPDKLIPRPRLEIQAGDILITRAGPRSRAAVTCLVRSARPRLIVCDKVYRLRPNIDMARPDYLEIVLNAPHILAALDELKTGISDSGVNLTQDKFRDLCIPLPPLSLQSAIVAEVERRSSIIQEANAQIDAKLKRSSSLRQSILKRAFEGKLVPQDPKDEPAIALLERIRRSHGVAQDASAKRSGRPRQARAHPPHKA